MNKEFKKFIEEMEQPNNQEGVNRVLPDDADFLQIAKYKICQQILSYQLKNKLTDEEIAKKTNLSLAETRDILFG
jgi:hypothetical protein